MRLSGWKSWCFQAGVLLTLLVGGVFAPTVHAGCVGPAVVASPDAGLPHRAETDSSSNALPDSRTHRSAPNPPPCSGPHCSGAPLAPQAPPATTISSSQEWACLAVVADGTDPQGITHRLEDAPHSPIFRTSSVYYPPR
ncbi:MAG: hypothetical protein ACYC3I_01985 [Gemmataceae bacterium]